MGDMLSRDYPPDALPYRGCNSLNPCEFWEYCTRDMPEQALMALPGGIAKKNRSTGRHGHKGDQ